MLVPPMSDVMSGKSRTVVGNADHSSTAIFHDVVNIVRNSDSAGIGTEVVIRDAPRSGFPTATGFEVADELTFFCVHANHGQMAAPETVAQLGQIFELQISVGMRTGRDLLLDALRERAFPLRLITQTKEG